MQLSPERFKETAATAVTDPQLKVALDRTTGLLQSRRRQVVSEFPTFEALRAAGKAIKDHTLANLAHYLELFEARATESGAKVHWAADAAEASRIVVDICKAAEAKLVTRVKSMTGEEIGLPDALEAAGITRVETDLAEHIIQLAGDPPSHIVMPAMHMTHEEVGKLFVAHHGIPPETDEIPAMVESARRELRPKYFAADVGISGANFLIAETGSVCVVTNEGNAELTTALPRVHIVTVGIEKLVPSIEHCMVMLRLLSRSALGTEITQYTTFFNGPKRPGDVDGPEEMHIVLIDNRRTEMLGSDMREMLRCIRCGACMNHCPVFGAVGGHAYGSVYPGPMGAILTPALTSLRQAKDLPQACTLNGRCQEVCPVKIPLTDLIRKLREREYEAGMMPAVPKAALALWAFAARWPALYRLGSGIAVALLKRMAGGRGAMGKVPLAGGWTAGRDFPAPAGKTFHALYKDRQHTATGARR